MTKQPLSSKYWQPAPEEIEYLERQVLAVPDFELPAGLVLDIGGGGSGIIGLLKGERAVSIDTLRSELELVRNEAQKLVMDARRLTFADGSFAAAAAFFGLMYIPAEDHETVFAEVHRVLEPGGQWWIWDVVLPAGSSKTFAMLPLTVHLPDGREIDAGYAARVRKPNLAHFMDLAQRTGFTVVEAGAEGSVLSLRLRKGLA